MPPSLQEGFTLRFILIDNSDCLSNCTELGYHEHYYSFNQVLDEAQEKNVVLALRGDDQPTSPIVRTGWVGILGNNVLDIQHIKGFSLEISMNNKGSIGSLASGQVTISNFAVGEASRLTANEAMSEESGIIFTGGSEDENSQFTHVPYAQVQVRPYSPNCKDF